MDFPPEGEAGKKGTGSPARRGREEAEIRISRPARRGREEAEIRISRGCDHQHLRFKKIKKKNK